MKIAFRVTCSNEFNDSAPTYGVVNITPELAQEILMIESCRVAFEQSLKSYSNSVSLHQVSVWNTSASFLQTTLAADEDQPADDDLIEEWEELVAKLDDNTLGCAPEYIELPDDFEVPGYGDGKWEPLYARTEADTIQFHGGSITFEAIPKHSDDRIESSYIPMSLFEQVASAARVSA